MILIKKKHFKKEKNAKKNDIEDIVYRFQLTYDEFVNVLDLKYIHTKRIGCSLKRTMYQIGNINNTLKIFYPVMRKEVLTIDEKIYKLILKINQTRIFTEKLSSIQI